MAKRTAERPEPPATEVIHAVPRGNVAVLARNLETGFTAVVVTVEVKDRKRIADYFGHRQVAGSGY